MNFGTRNELRVAIGLLLILVPAGYLVKGVAFQRSPPAKLAIEAPPPVTEVLTTTIDLHRGDVVSADHLGRMRILGKPPTGVLTDPRSAEFLVAVTDVPAGEMILRGALSATPAAAGLAALVPAGMRAIALRVSDEIAVGNFLRPGDHADLVAVFGPSSTAGTGAGSEARIVLQDVMVLTVGNLVSGPPPAAAPQLRQPRDIREMTLAVTPEQAAEIALIRSVATYYLALRNDHDKTRLAPVTADLADLRGAPPPAAIASKPRTVETLIGAKRRTVEVGP